MKILQLIYTLSSGGAERFVVDLSNELHELGHEVTICLLRDDKIKRNRFYLKCLKKEIGYINMGIPPGFKMTNSYRLYKVISKLNPDIVHCHLNLVNYIFPLTYVFPGKKFFHTIHSDATNEVKSKLEYLLRRFFYSKHLVRAITISPETTLSFLNHYKTNSYKEITNGRSLPTPSTELEVLKTQLKISGAKIFIHVGRFHPIKNQSMLIKVFNKLKLEGHNVFLYIIGSGFDLPEAQNLKQQAGEHIKFLGEKHNVIDYYYAADAFCLSSLKEGMPITVIEAMACGCTPICTPAGGIKNMLVDGKTGFISKSFSENHYYSTILRYLSDEKVINREKLKAEFKSFYHINICAKNYIKAFKQNN